MMPRNLDRRIEALVPIEHARSRQELSAVLDSVFSDDSHAWTLGQDGMWTRLTPSRPEKPIESPGGDDAARADACPASDEEGRTRK